jgi:hypothetical protein
MSVPLVDQLVQALLYEGYILYPYRASSKKNQQRFTFGRIYPEAYSSAQNGAEPCSMQTECLVLGDEQSLVLITVGFLQPVWREILVEKTPGAGFEVVPEVQIENERLLTWQEAIERRVEAVVQLPASNDASLVVPFSFAASEETANHPTATSVKVRRRNELVEGHVEVWAQAVSEQLWKLTVRILNTSPVSDSDLRHADKVLMQSCASTHTVLVVKEGEFVSLLEPPQSYQEVAAACENIGTWPVLVGDPEQSERHTLLSSPIILYDYPKVATESPGDLFDGTEIDEILSLRILAMTDEEKLEMRQVDDCARRILERTEALPETRWTEMHGVMHEVRDFFARDPQLEQLRVGQSLLKPGDLVKIRPKGRADAMDLILNGRTAVIEAIEQAVDGAVHLALVIEDDPGKDLGLMRQPGHRFFYTAEEVEPL